MTRPQVPHPDALSPCPLCKAWRKLTWSHRPTTQAPPRALQDIFVAGYWVGRNREENTPARFCEMHGVMLEKIVEREENERAQAEAARIQAAAEEETRRHAGRLARERAAGAVAGMIEQQAKSAATSPGADSAEGRG